MDVTQFISAILPTGLTGSAYLVFKALQMYRKGREQREDKVVNSWINIVHNLEKKVQDLEDESNYKDQLIDYWRNRSQVREVSLASAQLLSYEELHSYPSAPLPPPPGTNRPALRRSRRGRDDDDDGNGNSHTTTKPRPRRAG